MIRQWFDPRQELISFLKSQHIILSCSEYFEIAVYVTTKIMY